MKLHAPHKDIERTRLASDVQQWLAKGNQIPLLPIYSRSDDPLEARKQRRQNAGGARVSIAETQPVKAADAVRLHRMGYSRQSIAARLKISRTTISRWINAAARGK